MGELYTNNQIIAYARRKIIYLNFVWILNMSSILFKGYGSVNITRLGKFLEANQDTALYMGLWDKFKDIFRGCWATTKREQLKQLWFNLQAWQALCPLHIDEESLFSSAPSTRKENSNLLHFKKQQEYIEEVKRKINIFNRLRGMAETKYYQDFKILITHRGLEFKIGLETVQRVPILIDKEDNKMSFLVQSSIGGGSILENLETYGWGFVLDVPATKNATTRARYFETDILTNKKQAREIYRLIVKNSLNQIQDETARQNTIKLIIHFNHICNLVLRHDIKKEWSIDDLKKLAEPILDRLKFDDNQTAIFIYATLWLNFHRNKGQMARQLLKAVLLISAVITGIIVGPILGPCYWIWDRIIKSDESFSNKITMLAALLILGIVCGPYITSRQYFKAIMKFNTGDSLNVCTASYQKAIRSLLAGYNPKQVNIIIESTPGMADIVKFMQINGKFTRQCINQMKILSEKKDCITREYFLNVVCGRSNIDRIEKKAYTSYICRLNDRTIERNDEFNI